MTAERRLGTATLGFVYDLTGLCCPPYTYKDDIWVKLQLLVYGMLCYKIEGFYVLQEYCTVVWYHCVYIYSTFPAFM